MSHELELAKDILQRNSVVLYGIFGLIAKTKYFPPHEFLNEFLLLGNDPCDQDARMEKWSPFSLSRDDYTELKQWWIACHPASVENRLGANNWRDWQLEVIEQF